MPDSMKNRAVGIRMRKGGDPIMKLKEHIRIYKRGIRYLFSLSRSYMLQLIFINILRNLQPYVPIYFSALLVDGLYEGRPVWKLAAYASCAVGMVFLLELVKARLNSGYSATHIQMYRNQKWSYSQKAMEMSYASVEDPEVATLRVRIDKESQTGYNIWNLTYNTEELISSLTRILLSMSLTLSFFFLESVPLLMKLAFAGGVLLVVLCRSVTAKKEAVLESHFYDSSAFLNLLYDKYNSYVDHYSSGKDIRIYDMADGLVQMNKQIDDEYNAKSIALAGKIAVLQAADVFLNHVLRLGVYFALVYAALLGGITVGSVARYVSCVMLLLGAACRLTTTVQSLLINNHYLKRYFSYFDIPNPMYQGSLTVEKRDDNEYYVEFRDVSFRYPNTEAYALRHVNLKFRVGEKLAVVGRNGSGKTTFIKLMCRLYDPTEGEILLNGVNIKKYDYDEYMSIFSVVFQDFRIFALRLGENVAAGPDYDRERAVRCLKEAGFGERLASMPEGLDSFLKKDFDGSGIEVSGGEGQKIALARALYKDAPFLILDEPTAALDPISEYEIYSRFNEIAGDKTAIYISHRLASCRFCDKIAVFEGGGIVQTGSHASLLADEAGVYHTLWMAQAQYYTDAEAPG